MACRFTQSQTAGTELSPCYLSWWKYLCRWLVGPHRYRLQLQSHHHATYPSGSTCESGLSVHSSHRLQPQSHHHATYPGGSICVGGLLVHTGTDCSYRAITMLLILVEVPVKVACRSTTVTDCSHRAITMQVIVEEVLVKVACQSTTVTD